MKEQLTNAIAFAAEKHLGQYDQGGMPYILHPIAVMKYLETDDLEVMAIAIMHDVIEDCNVSYDQLSLRKFTPRIIEGVRGMTKIPGESVNDNLRRIMQNPDVVEVKLCDLRHNMDPRRLKGMTVKDMDRMNKYLYMYRMLILFKTGVLKKEDWSINRGATPGGNDES